VSLFFYATFICEHLFTFGLSVPYINNRKATSYQDANEVGEKN